MLPLNPSVLEPDNAWILPPFAPVLAPATNDNDPAVLLLFPEVIVRPPALPDAPLLPVDILIDPDKPLTAAPVLTLRLPDDTKPDASLAEPIMTLPPMSKVLVPAVS